MRFYRAVVGALLGVLCQSSVAVSTEGLQDLVKRRLPDHLDSFAFSLNASFETQDGDYIRKNDNFEVSSAPNGTILIQGNSLSALATG
jgi:alpha-N-acetylglucosaminidase